MATLPTKHSDTALAQLQLRGHGQNLRASPASLAESRCNVCMEGNGGPWVCVVFYFFFFQQIFQPRYMRETMKGREGQGSLTVNQISMCECKSILLLKKEPSQNVLHLRF